MIPKVLRSYRDTVHSSSVVSPAESMTGEKLPSLGHEAIAWEPYASSSTTEQPTPQGIGWYGQLVEKPFYCAKTKGLDLFQGEVEEIILTKEGEERIRLVYSDGDRESLQVGNILPWWVGSDGRTWLEAHSPISTALVSPDWSTSCTLC